jgi:aminoglycoside phosphotransferase (APT) family kinase protein
MDTVIDVLDHPGARAWKRLHPTTVEPASINVLREHDKAAVYLLGGVGVHGAPVIAKHCRSTAGLIERHIYEEILPDVPVTALHYYGHAREADGSCWLFLEKARGVPFSPSLEAHCVLVARWLAVLHTSCARIPAAQRLPDRGPTHYLEHLCLARRRILRVTEATPRSGERHLLQTVVRQCDMVESHWHDVEEWCADMPATLVHGDFRPKNVHVVTDGGHDRLVAMDWETSGWGVPAADIASARGLRGEVAGLTAYLSIARESWPDLRLSSLQRFVEVGKLFRRLAAIDWCSISLAGRWVKSIASMSIHRTELAAMIERARWT